MDSHRAGNLPAVNQAFEKLGLDCANWTEPVYSDLSKRSAGDEEKMVFLYFNRIGWPSSLPTNEQGLFAKRVLQQKEKALEEFVMSKSLPLRPGLEQFIDDAYNASPDSMKASIGVLSSIACTGKRIAVLADMLELGEHSAEAHQRVGRMVAQSNADMLYCYGEQSRHILQAAQQCGMQKVYWFDDKSRMAREIRKNIEIGDCILFKGSRGMRLEEVIYQIYRES